MPGETRALAHFLANLSFNELPPSVVDICRTCFLDWLGSALGGSHTVPAQIIMSIVHEMGGTQESTVIAHGESTSCMNAALANGTMSHILELDDVHKASTLHPAAAVMPAALAVAEREKADGKVLITAITAGYEAADRIGEAVNPSHYEKWHSTGTCGTFGAAAAAGRVLGLDEDMMIDALGNAGTQAAGLWEFLRDGAMSKHLHPGKAAANGVLSALLAKNGFTGASTILEGEKGFCAATADNYDLAVITKGLGEKLKILETSFKLHASCKHTHPAIDAIIGIRDTMQLAPDNVEHIRVKTYSVARKIANNRSPKTPYEAKFSLPYCVSIALIMGCVGVEEFTDTLLMKPEVLNLMEKVDVVVDPKLDTQYPMKWPTKVEVVTKDGKIYSHSISFPLGDPENPIGTQKLQDKFRSLASTVLQQRSIETIIDEISGLENVQNIRELTKLFR